MTWWVWLGLAVVALAGAFGGLSALGARRWDRATRALTGRLEAGRQPPCPTHYDPAELDGLPAPVQRWFRAVLTPGQALVSAANLVHTGAMNLSADSEQWKPFTSQQRVVLRRPGFAWNARIALAPGVPVQVHDAYVDGEGQLRAAVLGLFNLADVHGGGELARGELMRWLAEAAWYPTALLPSQGVRWQPVDDHSAQATLHDGPVSVTLLFCFDAAGQMVSMRAEARGRGVGKDMTMVPWEGRWSDFQRHNGMTVPMTGEVAWLLPAGRKTYWRGTVTELAYEWAE